MEHDPASSVPPQVPPDADPAERRGRLVTAPSPEPRLDYLVLLSASLPAAVPAALEVRYVPDRLVLTCRGWDAYCDALAPQGGEPLEVLAARILSDIGNELVPRWAEVRLRRSRDGRHHAVVLQERQPQWSDAALAALLRAE